MADVGGARDGKASVSAALVSRKPGEATIKLSIDGGLHVLRWRRRLFADEVLFDDRRVAHVMGLFGRDTLYGLAPQTEDGREIRLLLTIDAEPDWNHWSSDGRIGGVRLETADEALIVEGSFKPGATESFAATFERAARAVFNFGD